MKNCLTCNRIYEDDTLVFCLEDGTRLSASYAPHVTERWPGARDTNPPSTLILNSGSEMSNQTPLRPTIPAGPFGVPPEMLHEKRSEKSFGKFWIVLGGMLGLALMAVVILLGYSRWNAGNEPTYERAGVTTNETTSSNSANTIANTNGNPNQKVELKTVENEDLQWLEGSWEGEGYQSDTRTTWLVKLTAREGTYLINYPTIPCGGKWILANHHSRGASFDELINQGTDRCDKNDHVMMEKVSDSEISCKYTRAKSRVVIATAVLTKKSK